MNSLQNILGIFKDKIRFYENSGTYKISCKVGDQKYVGQTRKSMKTKFKEHIARLKCRRIVKSSVSQHRINIEKLRAGCRNAD